MKNRKRPKLPRGLYWDAKSPYIFFKWRDPHGKQLSAPANIVLTAFGQAFRL
ncbi:MAG TPA: hypothetical protein VJ848_11825 [Candidatus Angelobacter sp.]|nr:hypothetical protein [Candidatus Angelobacter sp.]